MTTVSADVVTFDGSQGKVSIKFRVGMGGTYGTFLHIEQLTRLSFEGWSVSKALNSIVTTILVWDKTLDSNGESARQRYFGASTPKLTKAMARDIAENYLSQVPENPFTKELTNFIRFEGESLNHVEDLLNEVHG